RATAALLPRAHIRRASGLAGVLGDCVDLTFLSRRCQRLPASRCRRFRHPRRALVGRPRVAVLYAALEVVGKSLGAIVVKLMTISLATENDRRAIYRLRHDVYARELGQHRANDEHELRDSLDSANVYIVAKRGHDLAG